MGQALQRLPQSLQRLPEHLPSADSLLTGLRCGPCVGVGTLRELEEERDALAGRLEAGQAEARELERIAWRLQQELRGQGARLEQATRRLQRADQHAADKEQECEGLRRSMAALEAHGGALAARLEALAQERAALSDARARLERELRDERARARRLEQAGRERDVEHAEQLRRVAEEERAALRAEVQSLRQQAAELEAAASPPPRDDSPRTPRGRPTVGRPSLPPCDPHRLSMANVWAHIGASKAVLRGTAVPAQQPPPHKAMCQSPVHAEVP